MKICSLYGAGFYYIPGTDMCLKVGGWVRQQLGYGHNGSFTTGPFGAVNVNNRATNDYNWRVRGYITADARSQSEYGTIRSYIAVGISGDNAIAFSSNRAFIQFAGFTFGLAQSFYDFMNYSALSYHGGNIWLNGDTGDGGKQVTTYTAQFGNGFSASIGIEAARSAAVFGATPGSLSPAAAPTNSQAGQKWPDVVANLRVDQAWGSAQIMGAIHNASAQYYSTLDGPHPSDVVGWAVGGGLRLNAPMIGPGDYFVMQAGYAVGATGYISNGTTAVVSYYDGGTNGGYGYGLVTDGVYGTTGSVDLTTAWGIQAAFEHNWNRNWKTSIYGGYVAYNYNETANAVLCAETGILTAAPTPAAGCNNDWATWTVGTRTQWTINNGLYMGLDLIYQKLETASAGLTTTVAGTGTQPTAVRTISDQDAFVVQFRVHRDFYP